MPGTLPECWEFSNKEGRRGPFGPKGYKQNLEEFYCDGKWRKEALAKENLEQRKVFFSVFFFFFLNDSYWSRRSSIQSAKTRSGADCGSDRELLIAKFRLKLKKVGKTTRPFRYNLNQIPYDYTVEVRNRFKGLDLIDRECLMNYGHRFVTL